MAPPRATPPASGPPPDPRLLAPHKPGKWWGLVERWGIQGVRQKAPAIEADLLRHAVEPRKVHGSLPEIYKRTLRYGLAERTTTVADARTHVGVNVFQVEIRNSRVVFAEERHRVAASVRMVPDVQAQVEQARIGQLQKPLDLRLILNHLARMRIE